jgi:hypothetical protein
VAERLAADASPLPPEAGPGTNGTRG